MNKKLKTCLLLLLIVATIISCSSISFFFGIISEMDDTDNIDTNDEQPSEITTITEKQVYYEQENTQRYFDEESPGDVYQKLINDASQHFEFEYSVNNVEDYEKDENFMLANIEHQYSRLSVLFNTELSNKVTIKLVDDFDQFKDDMGVDYDSDFVTHSGYALGNDFIEIYINPLLTIDKFSLAETCSHELVHSFQNELNYYIHSYVPTWYMEGMAEGLSFPQEDSIIHQDILEKVPNLDTLESFITSALYKEYSIGYDVCELFFLYLKDTYGDEFIINLIKIDTNFDLNFKNQIGIYPDNAYLDWIEQL